MPVLVEVERSGFVESRHEGDVAVCGADGTVNAFAGDPETPMFPRSSAKPFQALAVFGLGVEERLGVPRSGLAGAFGSHAGASEHVASARAVLAAAGLEDSALRCPPAWPANDHERDPAGGPAPIYHNCSGKHAYMLAGTVASGWLPERYTDAEHPLQAVVADTIAEYAGVQIEHLGVDGCGVPVHAMRLRGLATAFARLADRAVRGEAGPAALVAAVRAEPELVAGIGWLDTVLIEVTGGRLLAKVGAEAAYGVANLATGEGAALKVADGSRRAAGPALLAVLTALGWLEDAELEALRPLAETPLLGGGEPVGTVRAASLKLEAPDRS